MPLIKFDDNKGLVQQTGSGLVAVPRAEVLDLANNASAKTIPTRDTSDSKRDFFLVRVNPLGGSVSDVRLQAPENTTASIGRLLLLVNTNLSNNVVFAAQTDSLISGTDGSIGLDAGASILLVWDGARWSPTCQTLA